MTKTTVPLMMLGVLLSVLLVGCGDDAPSSFSGGSLNKQADSLSASHYIDCTRSGNRKVQVGDAIQAEFSTHPAYTGAATLVTLCDEQVQSSQPIELTNAQLEVNAELPESCGGNQSYTVALKTPHAVGLCTWSQNVISPVSNETLSEIVWLLD